MMVGPRRCVAALVAVVLLAGCGSRQSNTEIATEAGVTVLVTALVSLVVWLAKSDDQPPERTPPVAPDEIPDPAPKEVRATRNLVTGDRRVYCSGPVCFLDQDECVATDCILKPEAA